MKYEPKVRPTIREMSDVELAWLAGLLEGEGSFVVSNHAATARQRARTRVRVAVQMTDRDVVERVQAVVGLGNVCAVLRQKDHHKDSYVWAITAKADVDALLHLLRPHMGIRRQAQIGACLTAIKDVGERTRSHGTTKYKLEGCRCDECYSAKSAVNARRIRKR